MVRGIAGIVGGLQISSAEALIGRGGGGIFDYYLRFCCGDSRWTRYALAAGH
jgi:hypothetical protein